MIHTKRVIFMILPLLFVPVVYGMSSTPDACAAPMDPNNSPENCKGPEDKYGYVTCCWKKDGKTYCQACKTDGKTVNCGPVQGPIGLEQPPTSSPFDPTAPLQGGVFEQLPDQPPLFGRNEGAVPPTGGILQPFAPAPGFQPLTPRPFTSTPFQQIPQGQVQPFIQSETPPTLSPTPTPPPPLPPPTQTDPTIAPQDNQDDEGGGLPATQNQENVPQDDGVAEQPEDDGQEDSSEGAETAGPLT